MCPKGASLNSHLCTRPNQTSRAALCVLGKERFEFGEKRNNGTFPSVIFTTWRREAGSLQGLKGGSLAREVMVFNVNETTTRRRCFCCPKNERRTVISVVVVVEIDDNNGEIDMVVWRRGEIGMEWDYRIGIVWSESDILKCRRRCGGGGRGRGRARSYEK